MEFYYNVNLAYSSLLIETQAEISKFLGDSFSLSNPENFHITLVYILDSENAPVIDGYIGEPFFASSNKIECFSNGDSHAVVLRLEDNKKLTDLQKFLFSKLTNNYTLSEYSYPEAHKPHITLGYSEQPFENFYLNKPVDIFVDNYQLTGENYKVVQDVRFNYQKTLYEIKRTGENRIGGYAVVFGDSFNKDLEGDYFTENTDFMLDYFDNQIVLLDHNMRLAELPNGKKLEEKMPRDSIMGNVVKFQKDEIGLWCEAMVDDREEWVQYVLELIEQGKMNWSSGTIPHLVKRADDGNLKSWGIVEVSVTPTPAEPRFTNIQLIKSVYRNNQYFKDFEKMNNKVYTNWMEKNWSYLQPTLVKMEMEEEDTEKMDDENPSEEDNAKQGDLYDLLRPAAEQMAALVGDDVEAALQYLVDYAVNRMKQEMPMEEDYTMATEEAGDVYMEGKNAEKNKPKPKGSANYFPVSKGYSVVKSPNVISHLGYPTAQKGLTGFIQSVARKDHSFLKKHAIATEKQFKALGINPATAGGYLVDPEQSDQIIEILREQGKLFNVVRTVPMNSDVLNIPKLTGGVTASWVGENSSITAGDTTFGQVQLVTKKLGILVQISNELLDDASPDVDGLIRQDMVSATNNELDRVILRGSGTSSEPRGLFNISGITQTTLATLSYSGLTGMVQRIEDQNVIDDNTWRWVMPPFVKRQLRELETSSGDLIWSGSDGYGQPIAGDVSDRLLGYNWLQSTLTQASGASSYNLFLGKWSDAIFGMRKTFEIVASSEAGTAFQNDQTWIRMILRCDFNVRHEESFQILTGITG